MERNDHDLGLAHDLATLLTRRRALVLLGGAGLVALAGCGSGGSGNTSATAVDTTPSTTAATTGAVTAAIPHETAGPFPGDGSNGPDALNQSGVVRRDITSSFGGSSGTAGGVPTTVSLTIVDLARGAPYAGGAVYVWHCDREGRYSLYSQGVTDQNYLRGVQAAGDDGTVTFSTIFPGCYPGRWPHIHFEVYPSLAAATGPGQAIATSQLALPADTSAAVYATSGYEQSVGNLERVSLATDMVFRDGAGLETPTASGDADSGIALALTFGV